MVRPGSNTSSPLTLNTDAPQGWVQSPLLYSLYNYDCVATTNSNIIVKFVDHTTIIGLTSNNKEEVYREEVKTLVL